MEKSTSKNIRLGLFVLGGTLFFIYALYMIGSNRNLFGSTFRINAIFHNVNGLMKGNNVRFAGIDVGTVDNVKIINDSSVRVVLVIETGVQKYIRKNALASIGTDGLMGNKLVNINPVAEAAPGVSQGDTIKTMKPIETDEMLRTLNRTNNNIEVITDNLKTITDKFKSPNTLWSLLMDTVVADNVKQAIVNIRLTGSNTAEVTGDLSNIVDGIKSGKGAFGALLTDTALSDHVRQTIVKIKLISDNAAMISGNLSHIIARTDSGKGTIGRLLIDTTFVPNLDKSMANLSKGTNGLNEIIEGLKHSWPLRHYFRKQEKKRRADSAKALTK